MTRLELAAIRFHRLLWENTGDTDDWPIKLVVDDDEVGDALIDAANDLFDAVKEVEPEACKWPIERKVPGL